jgi:N-acetyl-alpha-D-muramate 1-phosphate uridylyltransferase
MRHNPDAVMIFAAGLGTRMRPLTNARPKALVEASGQPLIEHALALPRSAGVSRIVVNTHAHADQMHRYLKVLPDVMISHESALLDTGGGLQAALPILGAGPVFTLNSDAVWSDQSALTCLAAHWNPDLMDALLLLVTPKQAHGYTRPGSFEMDSEGKLTTPGSLVYTGAQIIKTEQLKDGPKDAFSIWWLWKQIFEDGRMFGCRYAGEWADVGTPEGIEIAEAMLDASSV